MKEVANILKLLGDETRLRIILLLAQEELTVTELAELLDLSQSRISEQVSKLRSRLFLHERREGRKTFLSLAAGDIPETILMLFAEEIEASRVCRLDQEALAILVKAREGAASAGFDPRAGSLGKEYLPGRTWEGFARAMLNLVPAQKVLDVGPGTGDMTLLLAHFASELHVVDIDPGALKSLRARAKAHGLTKLHCHEASVAALPLADEAVDLVVLSQILHHVRDPQQAMAECYRVLAPGGRVLVLDLKSHDQDWLRAERGHLHLGFSAAEISALGKAAGFKDMRAYPVARDPQPPRFVTLVATGRRTE